MPQQELLKCRKLPMTVIKPGGHGEMPVGQFYIVPADQLITGRGINPQAENITAQLVEIEFPTQTAALRAHKKAIRQLSRGGSIDLECTIFEAKHDAQPVPVRLELPMGGVRMSNSTHLEVLVYVFTNSVVSSSCSGRSY